MMFWPRKYEHVLEVLFATESTLQYIYIYIYLERERERGSERERERALIFRFDVYKLFFIIHVKARAIPCPHQPPNRGDYTVSLSQVKFVCTPHF